MNQATIASGPPPGPPDDAARIAALESAIAKLTARIRRLRRRMDRSVWRHRLAAAPPNASTDVLDRLRPASVGETRSDCRLDA